MSDHTVVHVRLPDDVLRQYQAEAAERGMTTVDVLAWVLERLVKDERTPLKGAK